jgi:hypothetical protein
MLLALAVLFVALSPGVLFTIPPLGNKMGGRFSSIVLHAIVFVIAVNLLNVVQEGFQMKNTLEKATANITAATSKVGAATSKVGAAMHGMFGMGARSRK